MLFNRKLNRCTDRTRRSPVHGRLFQNERTVKLPCTLHCGTISTQGHWRSTDTSTIQVFWYIHTYILIFWMQQQSVNTFSHDNPYILTTSNIAEINCRIDVGVLQTSASQMMTEWLAAWNGTPRSNPPRRRCTLKIRQQCNNTTTNTYPRIWLPVI